MTTREKFIFGYGMIAGQFSVLIGFGIGYMMGLG